MSEEWMNSYRLTSMEEPGDERLAQIMREIAEDARDVYGDWNNQDSILKAANYCNEWRE